VRKADPELHERRRRQIIDAARTCFVAHGFHQTGVQDIATAADISLGLLYRYFRNKDALILEVARRDIDALIDAVAAIPEMGDVSALWGKQMQKFALALASDESEMRLLNDMQSEAARNPALLMQMQADDARLINAIERKLHFQKSAGSLPPGTDIAKVALKMTVIFDGILVRMASAGSDEREGLERMLNAWVRELLA
jgi:AcrR family transcriptional regulator